MCATFCSLPLRQYALASNNRGSMLTLTAFKSLLAAYAFNLFFTNHCICIFLVKNFRTILWGIPYHLQLCLKFPWATCVVNTSWNFRDESTLRQGWRQQSSDGGQELLTGGLKWEKWNGKNAVFVHHFAKFPPTETRNFLQHRGAIGFRQGAVAPSGPPLAPRHHCFEAPPCHKDNQKWGSNSIQAIR